MARIEELGCSVDDREHGINVDAPSGRHFVSTGTHTLALAHRGWKRGDQYARFYEDLSMGVADCAPECECRVPEE